MQKMAVIGAFIAAVVLVAVSVQINPYLLTHTGALKQVAQQRNLFDFFRIQGFSAHQGESSVTSVYRGGPFREGSFKVDQLKLPLKLTWQLDQLMGTIHTASKATPAVDETGIYFGTDLGLFYRLDHSGKILWSFRSEGGPQGIHGTALLDQNYVYFGNYGGRFYCLEKESGNLVWSVAVADAVGSSPLIVGNKIIFSAEFGTPLEGYLIALDLKTGEKIWTSPYFGEQVHSSPTFAKEAQLLGVGSNNGIYWGVDLETGQIRWEYETREPIKGTAVSYQGLFCLTSWDAKLHCLKELNGELDFQVDLGGASQSSPALDQDSKSLFVSSASAQLYKVSLSEKKILRQADLKMSGKTNRYSPPSPVFLKGSSIDYVVMPCEDTKVCFFRASDLKLEQKLEVGGAVSGSFAVWENAIYALIDSKGIIRIN